ncbi:MAG: NADH-quinone oxidoreductase subunit N [Candidatus Omnitrophica bacterium]|nr:NADH-quinone oxidoreductase subunit N [Candidatus Omnitrophota bacterium]
MSTVLFDSLRSWWPETILSAGALIVFVAASWTHNTRPVLALTWATLGASALALWQTPVPPATELFFGLIVCDPFSLVFRWLALVAVAMTVLLMGASNDIDVSLRGEAYGLLLLIAVGLMLMAEANHLLMAYVAMELVSLSAYVLAGFLDDSRSAEASLKYLLFGALSSGIMLFGMSLLFGLTGQLAFPDIARACTALSDPATQALSLIILLLLAGLAFKISMVPFHMWTPDVYEGAPVAVTALLSVGPKAAGFALLIRLMHALQVAWPPLVATVAALTIVTMTFGNLVALVQTNVKRLLAYSTIGQVGYLLIGFAVNTSVGLQALLVYLVAYLFMNLGAFACVVAVVNESGSESLDAFRGLATRAPGLALACSLFLLSLAGIPPLVGFIGKFLLFGAAIEGRQMWLAVAAAFNSAIALYYYVNLIRLMYFGRPVQRTPFRVAPAIRLALGVCAVATLALGLLPGALLSVIHAQAILNLL